MAKKFSIILIIVALAIAIVVSSRYLFFEPANNLAGVQSQCQVKEITFYYLDGCEWCQKVKGEETIDKIKQLGIKVKAINAAIGPVRHKFDGVPAFVINDQVYSGYRTFEELKELLGCPSDDGNTQNSATTTN